MMIVTVYSTGPDCRQCQLTCACLEQAEIPHQVVDVTNPQHAAGREFVTGQLGYTQAPVVVVAGDPITHWCGFRPDLIEQLRTAGDLS